MTSILDTLRQPKYTGENRCEPCTVLNVGIATVLGALVARKSNVGGLFVAVISIVVIYLRGYLVPGTPTVTERYLPPAILRWFGKETEPMVANGLDTRAERPSTETESTGGAVDDSDPPATDPTTASIDLETYFLDHGVLEPCSDSDDLCLTGTFEAAWLEEAGSIDDSDLSATDVAGAFGFEGDSDAFELVVHGETHRLRSEMGQVGRWPSRPALVADIAASRVFRTRVPDWNAHDPREKGQLLNSLRMFLETCPTTGGGARVSEEVVESCCRSQKVIAVTCEETGERLFEHRIDDIET